MIGKKYGIIVNIASIYGAVGDIFPAAPYYASKGAVINLTRSLVVEWAPHKINVNAIALGFFPSEMTEEIFADEEAMKHILSKTPLGRAGEPLDLKAALIYLASPACDYVTGQTIFIDGGWTAASQFSFFIEIRMCFSDTLSQMDNRKLILKIYFLSAH